MMGDSKSYSDRRVEASPVEASPPAWTEITGQEASTVPTYQVLCVANQGQSITEQTQLSLSNLLCHSSSEPDRRVITPC